MFYKMFVSVCINVKQLAAKFNAQTVYTKTEVSILKIVLNYIEIQKVYYYESEITTQFNMAVMK